MTNLTSYQPPVNKLLTLGDYNQVSQNGYDYIAELGFGSQHIPELIQIAVDKELIGADSDSLDNSLQKWAPIHAWRILGLLRAEDAIAPLMQLFHELEDNDWVAEEMPKIYGMIGESAISALQAYIKDTSHGVFPRVTAVNSLQEIGTQHPQARSECIAVLSGQLEQFSENPEDLNSFIISSLIELEAKKSALIIKDAFTANKIAEEIVGSWEEVREELGVTADDLESLAKIQVSSDNLPVPEASTDDVPEITTPSDLTPSEGVDIETNIESTPDIEDEIRVESVEQVSSDNLPIENVDKDKIETDIPEKVDNQAEDTSKKIEENSAKPKVSVLPDFKSAAGSSTQKNSHQGFGKKTNSQAKSKKGKKKKR